MSIMKDANTGSDRVKHIAIATAALLTVVLLGAFLYSRLAHDPREPGASRQGVSLQDYFQETERKGILSANDYARLGQVSAAIENQHQITDADLDSWVAVLQKGPLKDTPSNRMGFNSIVLGLGVGRKHLTPPQQEKMYNAVLPFVSDAAYAKAIDPSDTRADPSDPTTQKNLMIGEEEIAVMLLAETRDPRALSVLKDLAQNSPYPHLRRTALKEHDKLAAALAAAGQPAGESKQ